MAKKLAFSPLGDKVLVKADPPEGEKKLASGIILPASVNKSNLLKGEVVAVGPGRMNDEGKRLPLEISVGDTVWFEKTYGVEPIKMENEEFYRLSEDQISLIQR